MPHSDASTVPMLTRLSAEQRREQLVSAALSLALRQGLDAVTVRAVADQADVSFGIVHYCFDSKDALVAALIERIITEQLEAFTGDDVLRSMAEPAGIGAQALADRLDATMLSVWRKIAEFPDRWILHSESMVMSFRAEPGSPLHGIGERQNRIAEHFVAQFLQAAAEASAMTWTVPLTTVVGAALQWVDGILYGWLSDRDDDAARSAFELLTGWLCGFARPA